MGKNFGAKSLVQNRYAKIAEKLSRSGGEAGGLYYL
jgi:hypothetical protein